MRERERTVPIDVRPLSGHELDAAVAVLNSAGLATPRSGLELYLALQPDGYFAAFDGDECVGTVGAMCYDAFAFVGMMAVRPDHQGRGLGRALMEHLLDWLAARGVSLSVLEATAAGAPLYLKLGYVGGHETVVYRRQPGLGHWSAAGAGAGTRTRLLEPRELDALLPLDRRCFGADRRVVLTRALERWPRRAFLAHDTAGRALGYALARERGVGPWVAVTFEAAAALFERVGALPYEDGPTVFLPEPNRAGARLLEAAGFVRLRRTRRMWRGPAPPTGDPAAIYGLMTLGIG
jgi:GNAT superfamily N-acetyltransferase